MARWHLRAHRSPSGRLMHRLRKKRRQDRGQEFLETTIGEREARIEKSRGGSVKARLLTEQTANVADPKTKKIVRSKILTVVENPANIHYVRRNVLTHGAVIKTELGLARVTSRPSQSGIVNAVLIEKK